MTVAFLDRLGNDACTALMLPSECPYTSYGSALAVSLYLVHDDAVNTVAAENPDGEVHLKARAVTRKLSFENGQLAARFEGYRIYRDGEGFGFNASLVGARPRRRPTPRGATTRASPPVHARMAIARTDGCCPAAFAPALCPRGCCCCGCCDVPWFSISSCAASPCVVSVRAALISCCLPLAVGRRVARHSPAASSRRPLPSRRAQRPPSSCEALSFLSTTRAPWSPRCRTPGRRHVRGLAVGEGHRSVRRALRTVRGVDHGRDRGRGNAPSSTGGRPRARCRRLRSCSLATSSRTRRRARTSPTPRLVYNNGNPISNSDLRRLAAKSSANDALAYNTQVAGGAHGGGSRSARASTRRSRPRPPRQTAPPPSPPPLTSAPARRHPPPLPARVNDYPPVPWP